MRAALMLARHEVRRVAGAFRSPATLLAMLAAFAVLAVVAPLALERGIQPDRGIYPVRLEAGSPFEEAVLLDHRFALAEPSVLHIGATIAVEPSAAGRAAYEALRDAVRVWQERRLEREPDQAAAFPVSVNLILAAPNQIAPAGGAAGVDTTAGGAAGGPAEPQILDLAADAASVQPALRPAQVEPPFPVRSLLLTFAFLIPMNFVAQLHAGTLLADRVRRRALIALTTPHAPGTILFGRSLPYIATGALVLVGAGLATGSGWQGWLAAVPIISFVISTSLLLGLLARSERELTFLLTGATTMLAIFLFLPAVFTAIPAVAFLSPVSVIVSAIQGDFVPWGTFAYATLPLSLCTLALTLAAAGLYREETLFSPRRLRDKLLSGMATKIRSLPRVVAAGILVVPFAFVLELLVLSFAIPLGLRAALPVTLVGVALVEERLKLGAVAAHRRTGGIAWKAALWVGVGFFLGEKIALLLAVVGFGALPLGTETLRVFGVAGGILLVLAPLVVHAACSLIASLGLGRNRIAAAAWFLLAAAVHLAYNLAVIWSVP
jgi:ABC-type Na+ efflux pump permease subunit